MRRGKKNMISAGIRSILMLVLLLCLTAPASMAETEAQKYRKIASDLKKQGVTRADVERECEKLKSIKFGDNIPVKSGENVARAVRDGSLKHHENILKYWPAEEGSGAGQGYSEGSRNTINEEQVGYTLNELARLSNEKVITRSAASSIDEMKDNARGGIDYEIPVDPNMSNHKNQTNMDVSELWGMVESSNVTDTHHARQSERDRDAVSSINNILTDDFMGANSVSVNSFVNDIPVSEYEKAVEHWAYEMGKHPKGSDGYIIAHFNYEDAVLRLKAKKAADQRVRVELNLGNSENVYKARPQSKKKNVPQPKALPGQERKGDSWAYSNVKVNGMRINMPQNQRGNRPENQEKNMSKNRGRNRTEKPTLKSDQKQENQLPPPPKGQVETYTQTINPFY